jgi:hypothetical protein
MVRGCPDAVAVVGDAVDAFGICERTVLAYDFGGVRRFTGMGFCRLAVHGVFLLFDAPESARQGHFSQAAAQQGVTRLS